MSLGIEAAVENILKTVSPAVPVLSRDVVQDPPFDADGAVAPYVIFFVVVSPPAPFALQRGGTILRRGFVQVTVRAPEHAGRPAARVLAEKVITLFPRLTQLGRARVERPAYATEPMQDTPYYNVPVTIPWDARVPEGE